MSDLKAELADIAAALEEKTDAVTVTSAPQTGFLRHPHTGDTVELEADPAKLVPYIPRRPSVLTIHDLSPWMKPRWHHAAERVRRRTPVLLELGIATMIVTPGEGVRKEAIERLDRKST